jgi:diguanylate cyclase (GGDEF)-like protein
MVQGMAVPIPANESERLATLRDYQILDTPPEAAFERITELASRVFNVPVALVSLIDEKRQWLKSCRGFDRRETSRDIAFCAYAILQDAPMVVENALQDPRFAENPLVTGTPGVRFYAGAPLRSPRGYSIGTLCVLDTSERQFSGDEVRTLEDLATIVVDELELRLLSRMLRNEVILREEVQHRLAEFSSRDPLTGLLNRGALMEGIVAAIERAKTGTRSALFYLALDSFKLINEGLDHVAGDRFLTRIADALSSGLPAGDMVARIGGDAFAMIRFGVHAAELRQVGDELRDRVGNVSLLEHGLQFSLTASVGAALIERSASPSQLLAETDAACHLAKAHGRNRVELVRDSAGEIQKVLEEATLASQLLRSLQEDAFDVVFHPVVNLATSQTEFSEMIIRVRDSALADGDGSRLTDAAGRVGLAVPLDRVTLRNARVALEGQTATRISIRVSGASLRDAAWLAELRTVGNASERLLLIVSELDILRNVPAVAEMMRALRKEGFLFCIADFGIGGSNLAYLKSVPADFIRLGNALLEELDGGSTSAGFIRAICTIAAHLGLRTIAPCAADEGVLSLVRKLGVTHVQGGSIGLTARL